MPLVLNNTPVEATYMASFGSPGIFTSGNGKLKTLTDLKIFS